MNFSQWIPKSAVLLLLVFFLTSCQGSLMSSRLPGGVGVYHVVQSGQTPYRIARTYGVSVRQLIRINRIGDPASVRIGTRLWIPGANRVRHVSSQDNSKRPVPKKKSVRKKTANKSSKKKRAPVKNFLRWPVKGTLTSTFGKRGGRKHEGIDIGASKGTPIYAAADGQVMFSDWGPTGYGLMVIIKHKHHLTTVYAHNSKNWVRKNAWVKRGQKIASIGKTGRATGPHLHFEVRNDTQPRNPLKYLPSKR
jgi:murein DD-endopeptidase MepM/ murein hydrolase activator NlpD